MFNEVRNLPLQVAIALVILFQVRPHRRPPIQDRPLLPVLLPFYPRTLVVSITNGQSIFDDWIVGGFALKQSFKGVRDLPFLGRDCAFAFIQVTPGAALLVSLYPLVLVSFSPSDGN